jgi:DNA-binding XRE family transcriptional regulator
MTALIDIIDTTNEPNILNPTPMTRTELIQFMQAHPLITASRLAEAVGVSRQMMSQILAEKKNLTLELGKKIRVELMRYDGNGQLMTQDEWIDQIDRFRFDEPIQPIDNDGGNG